MLAIREIVTTLLGLRYRKWVKLFPNGSSAPKEGPNLGYHLTSGRHVASQVLITAKDTRCLTMILIKFLYAQISGLNITVILRLFVPK